MKKEQVLELSTSDLQALKRFASLERKLLEEYPLYVSNLDSTVIRHLTRKSPATRDMNISVYIASDGNRDVARCAAFINPRYQAAKNENVGFIGYFAAAPNCETSTAAMLGQAEIWLKERGITRIIAPINGSILLGYGVLTDAYNEEPVMLYGWNPPYYPAYFTQVGFLPKYPLLVYTFDFSSEKYQAAKKRIAMKHDFQLRPINKKRWYSDLEIFRNIINENFTEEYLWYPVTADEFMDSFEAIKPLIDPYLMVIAEVQGKAVGVMIAYPNWNPLIRGFKGKIGNIQKIQFLLRKRHYRTGGVVLGAVNSEYRGRGIGQALEISVFQRYEDLGLKRAVGYTVDEDNVASRKTQEAIGGVSRLQYHVYDKNI